MKFVSVRDFRNRAAAVRKRLAREHEIVLTANGKPVAVIADVNEDTFEGKIAALRGARANAALDRIHAHARKSGADRLTMEEIDAEIARARSERRSGQ